MRLAYDHQIWQAQPHGGISRYFREIIERTQREPGVETRLFLGLHISRLELKGGVGIKLPWSRKIDIAIPRLNAALFRAYLGATRPEIYHQTYYAELAPTFRGKRVVTVHDCIHEAHPEFFKVDHPASRLKREAVNRADAVIAVSESTKRDLMRFHGTPAEKITVIHHANSLTHIPASSSPEERPYFLYVGSREGYKNFGAALEALASSERLKREFRLVCLGGGAFNREESARIQTLGLKGSVVQRESDDQALATYYAHAVAFVYPSKYEGFGIPLLEAMHYDCPVITARTSSTPEVAGDAALYFNPAAPLELAEQLEKIVTDSQLAARLKKAGRVRENAFSWDIAARETLRVYKALLAT